MFETILIHSENLTYFGRIEFKTCMEERQQAVLEILEVRGFAVPEEVRARILATRNLGLLKQWHRRAVTISSLEELFA